MARLTAKRKAFIEYYLQTWNATRAAERAGYKHPRTYGSFLTKLDVMQRRIKERLLELAMDADEIVIRLARQARAKPGDVLYLEGIDPKRLVKNAKPASVLRVNWTAVLGPLGGIVKKISFTNNGPVLELYDAQAALVQLAKLKGLYVERHKVGFDLDDLFTSLPPDFRAALRDFLAGAIAAGDDS